MSERFAHQLRLDQIRDGERLDLVADEAERWAIAERLGLPASTGWRRMCAEPNRRRGSRRRPAGRRARAELRRHRRAGRRACRRAVPLRSCRSRRAVARTRRSSSARRLRHGVLRRRDNRCWRGDWRHAGAQPRSLSAQRGRGRSAQGSRRADRRAGRARSRCSPSSTGESDEGPKKERRRRGRCRTPPAADATGCVARRAPPPKSSPKFSLNAAAAAAPAFAAVEQHQLAAEILQHDSVVYRSLPDWSCHLRVAAGLRDRPSTPCANSSWRRGQIFVEDRRHCATRSSPSARRLRSFQFSDVATRS